MKEEISNINLSIVIPFRNERDVLKDAASEHNSLLHPQVEIIYVNDGSTDESVEMLQKFSPDAKLITLKGLGTGKAFYEGAKAARGKFIFLLPVDCSIGSEGIKELIEACASSSFSTMLFPKTYSDKKILAPYAFLQNIFLLRLFKIASWTNGFVMHRSLLPELKSSVETVFLNDLEFSRNLRGRDWFIFRKKISVSTRRYNKDGAALRVVTNGIILMLWFFKLSSPEVLYRLYKRGKG